MSLNYLAFKWPVVNWNYSWSEIWKIFFRILKAIYQAMNSIKIFDIGGAFSVSVWDLSIAFIIMGTIISLFINFTRPTMPDKWDAGVGGRFAKNSKRMANNVAEKYGPYIRF